MVHRRAGPLGPPTQGLEPNPRKSSYEAAYGSGAGRHGVVVQPAVDHPPQPLRCLVDVFVHPRAESLLEPFQGSHDPFRYRLGAAGLLGLQLHGRADAQTAHLAEGARPAQGAGPGTDALHRPRRVDYEYERAGTASVFLFAEPLAGWRQATARARRTKADWAVEVAGLLEGRYAECEKVILVCDNLNTHTKGAFYEVFEPARARQLVRRLEFCYTPKHGSWLNIAENELSAMTRQCLQRRRIGDVATLHGEVSAWSVDVNNTQRGVDWHMKVDDARCKQCPVPAIRCRTPGRFKAAKASETL